MKCWICGKEESNADVTVNVERLIDVVREQFEHEQSYAMACKKPYWKWTPEEKETYIKYDRERSIGNDGIRNLCEILNLNWKNLDLIAKLVRRWEVKYDWQKCFPVKEHSKQIMKYITKKDPFSGTEIDYIHYKINKSAPKKAA